MSDLIAVMELGHVAQMDEPRAIYFRPANEFVARFAGIGAADLLLGVCRSQVAAGGLGAVVLDDGDRIACVFPGGGAAGRAVTVAGAAESLIVTSGSTAMNSLMGTVTSGSFLGGSARYDVRVKQRMLRVTTPSDFLFANGSAVSLSFASGLGGCGWLMRCPANRSTWREVTCDHFWLYCC